MALVTTLNVRVVPRAGRQSVELDEAGNVRVRVTAPPEDGKANRQVIELMAETLHLRKSAIEIMRGETGRSKVLRITGIAPTDLQRLLHARG
jgi:uncharacterized protein